MKVTQEQHAGQLRDRAAAETAKSERTEQANRQKVEDHLKTLGQQVIPILEEVNQHYLNGVGEIKVQGMKFSLTWEPTPEEEKSKGYGDVMYHHISFDFGREDSSQFMLQLGSKSFPGYKQGRIQLGSFGWKKRVESAVARALTEKTTLVQWNSSNG